MSFVSVVLTEIFFSKKRLWHLHRFTVNNSSVAHFMVYSKTLQVSFGAIFHGLNFKAVCVLKRGGRRSTNKRHSLSGCHHPGEADAGHREAAHRLGKDSLSWKNGRSGREGGRGRGRGGLDLLPSCENLLPPTAAGAQCSAGAAQGPRRAARRRLPRSRSRLGSAVPAGVRS